MIGKDVLFSALDKIYDSKSYGKILSTDVAHGVMAFTLFRGKFALHATHSMTDNTYCLDINNNKLGLYGLPMRGVPAAYHDNDDIARAAFNHIVRLDKSHMNNSVVQQYIINTIRARDPMIFPYTVGRAGIGYSIVTPDMSIRASRNVTLYTLNIKSNNDAAPIPAHYKAQQGPFAQHMFDTLHEMYWNQKNAR